MDECSCLCNSHVKSWAVVSHALRLDTDSAHFLFSPPPRPPGVLLLAAPVCTCSSLGLCATVVWSILLASPLCWGPRILALIFSFLVYFLVLMDNLSQYLPEEEYRRPSYLETLHVG